jgi:hypothetical protein
MVSTNDGEIVALGRLQRHVIASAGQETTTFAAQILPSWLNVVAVVDHGQPPRAGPGAVPGAVLAGPERLAAFLCRGRGLEGRVVLADYLDGPVQFRVLLHICGDCPLLAAGIGGDDLHLQVVMQLILWVKIGAKVTRHSKYVTFQLAEVAVPR